jgi:biopolymer transport protein ExbB
MIHLEQARDALVALIDLGGWVVALILALSVVAGAVVLWKLVQFRRLGVGRHDGVLAALAAADRGEGARAQALAEAAPSHLAPLLALALHRGAGRERLYTLAEARLARLEGGFRLLETVAQIAPLLGLFGTVLGMIDAFRAMQAAGQDVDPSVLAGGIWVALMTTAAGLAVAMPASAILTWLESRVAAERRLAETLIEGALAPGPALPEPGVGQAMLPRAMVGPAHA